MPQNENVNACGNFFRFASRERKVIRGGNVQQHMCGKKWNNVGKMKKGKRRKIKRFSGFSF